MAEDEATMLIARRPMAMLRSAILVSLGIAPDLITICCDISSCNAERGRSVKRPRGLVLWSSYGSGIMLMAMRVLIAEDELRLADAIARGLRRQGIAVDLAPDGEQALGKARVVRYDVLVLDRDLPGVHGDDVCRTIRGERPETGILMLTAAGHARGHGRGAVHGRRRLSPQAVSLRRAGRADPGPGPAGHAEPAAGAQPRRARARSRRGAGCTRGGREIELARKEFGVLEVLMAADGATVSAEELLERVWDEHTDPFTNVVRMTIMTLRRKLGDPPVVETVIGVGYRMA